MSFVGEVWRVVRATPQDEPGAPPPTGVSQETLGEILIEDADFPWLRGSFTPGPGFDAVKPLFDREMALTDSMDEDGGADSWEAAYDEVLRTVSLVAPEGPVAEFLLHIEDGQAWFRWSDRPFGQKAEGAG